MAAMNFYRAIAMPNRTAWYVSAEQFENTSYIKGIWIFRNAGGDV